MRANYTSVECLCYWLWAGFRWQIRKLWLIELFIIICNLTKILDGLPILSSMLSMPPHCHRALHLRCSKVPGSDSGICLLEKLMIILLSQHMQLMFCKLSTIFLIKRSLSPAVKYLFKLITEKLAIRHQNNSNGVFIVNFE